MKFPNDIKAAAALQYLFKDKSYIDMGLDLDSKQLYENRDCGSVTKQP